jgi:hypothetical protein
MRRVSSVAKTDFIELFSFEAKAPTTKKDFFRKLRSRDLQKSIYEASSSDLHRRA